MSQLFTGTGVAIVTPFNDNKSIDYASFEKLLNHIIEGGVESVVVLGTTGESVTLSKEEKKDVVAFVVEKTAGRVPVIAGIGGNNTADIIHSVHTADLEGVSGILSVSPYYNKPSQQGIYEHYKTFAAETSLPIIIYNVPGRTGSNICAATTLRLANEVENIVAIKEASGNLCQIMEIIKNKPEGFKVVSGDDALTYSMVSLGGDGVISVVANSHPSEFSSMVRALLNNDMPTARPLHYRLLEYMGALFTEGSPPGIKAALEIMGICKNVVRMPLSTVSNGHYRILQDLLKKI